MENRVRGERDRVNRMKMTTGVVQEQNLEKQIGKQMGCMAGFFHIFDRHQILTGKRLYSPKPLSSSSSGVEPASESPDISRELAKPQKARSTPSPDRFKQSVPETELRYPAPEPTTPMETQSKLPLPLNVPEVKEGTRYSSWKFSREAPRLSLDSRAIVDAKGKIHPKEIRTKSNCSENSTNGAGASDKQLNSPSVVARLMGLEPLQHSDPDPVKKAELRRSSSESRLSRDLYNDRFIDGNNFHLKQSHQSDSQSAKSNSNCTINMCGPYEGGINRKEIAMITMEVEPKRIQNRGMGQRKSFFDSADFFPEPKQSVTIYGEIEKRLKMRGIHEPSKDLETLKQILDALQLKGLLHHSRKSSNQINNRNFVHDRSFSHSESQTAGRKLATKHTRRICNESPPSGVRSKPGTRRNVNLSGEMLTPVSPRREQRSQLDRNGRNQTRVRNPRSPNNRIESNVIKSPNRKLPLSIDTQRRRSNDCTEQKRASPVHSPKISPRRIESDSQTTNRSPSLLKKSAEIYPKEEKFSVTQTEDDSSTISENSISTYSQTDTERSDNKEGRNLLERCDKLLHNIAEITATESQPSPVSVLDSTFYKEEDSSPSPVMKRRIDFQDAPVDLEDNVWSQAISSIDSKSDDKFDDWDFAYISDILRASNYLPEGPDIFLLLEKQQYLKGRNTSKVSTLQRKLIFDIINEFLDRNRQLPPWKSVLTIDKTSLQQIWSEFQRIRERDSSSDSFEVICGVLRRDLADNSGWVDRPVEMSKFVLDIERLVFKDLIGETIRDLATLSGKEQCFQILFSRAF